MVVEDAIPVVMEKVQQASSLKDASTSLPYDHLKAEVLTMQALINNL